MRRVQQLVLHVSSSISRDYVISVSVLCIMICVRVGGRCVRVCVLEPHIRAIFLLCLLLLIPLRTLLLCVCGPLLRMFRNGVLRSMRVCVVCAPRTYTCGTTAIAQKVFVDHFYAYVDIAYICVCVMCVL